MSTCCLETNCIQCCLETNMFLTYRDIETIEKIGYDKKVFVSERNGWLQLKNHRGRCVFHDGRQCTIYDQRPEGCTLYPVVYNKTDKTATLDNECPQRHRFSLSKEKTNTLMALIAQLQKERTKRITEKSLGKNHRMHIII